MTKINFDKMEVETKNILSETKNYKKLGRKKLSENEKRTEKISVYLTKEQKEQVVKNAHLNFMGISDYILQRVLNG